MSHLEDSVLDAPAPAGQTAAVQTKTVYGALAEFSGPAELLEAARAMRARGYTKLDAYSPFAIHGLDGALGLKRSKLGWIVAGGGLAGMTIALLLQWWTGAVDYPLVIGGKPFFAVEFSIPVTFELTVLLAAFGAVFGMFALNGLPRFHHPAFESERFRRASDDGFFLAVEAKDPEFDEQETVAALREAGARHAEVVES